MDEGLEALIYRNSVWRRAGEFRREAVRQGRMYEQLLDHNPIATGVARDDAAAVIAVWERILERA